MTLRRSTPLALLALAAAASQALAQSTYIVDDDGGPGVQFTDLPAAIAAASAGDRLSVQAGVYSAFVLDKGLAIVGHGGVRAGNARIQSIPAGQVAVLAGLEVRQLDILQCAGPVLIDELVATDTPWNMFLANDHIVATVEHCADVRLQRSQIIAPPNSGNQEGLNGMFVRASRVELAGSFVQGNNAGNPPSSGCWDGNPGGRGLFATDNSRLHVAGTTLRGGNGTNGTLMCGVGGDGGDALYIHGGSEVIVAGLPTDVLRGGANGTPVLQIARPGRAALVANGSLRYSGASFVSGGPGYPPIAGVATLAVPPDPLLELEGLPQPGQSVGFRLFGVPGFNMRLQQGQHPIVIDDGLTEIERLCNRIRLHPLGPVPPSGELLQPMTVPASAPTGWLRVFQGYEIDSVQGVLAARTNSAFVVVR